LKGIFGIDGRDDTVEQDGFGDIEGGRCSFLVLVDSSIFSAPWISHDFVAMRYPVCVYE